MAFIESLRTLNSILSSDLLIESRYDIMYNLSALNTYATTAQAGQIQIAAVGELNEGDGFGAVTPVYLSGASMQFPLKYNTSIVTTALLASDDTSLASVEYVNTEIDTISAYVDTKVIALDARYLRADISTYPITPNLDLGRPANKWLNVYATTFNGTATAALYADLAEKYTCSEPVEIGDVISIYTGEEDFEVQKTQGEEDYKIIGVVSEKPGFLMSQETDGPIVGLVGKVPVKVVGTCKRGDTLVPSSIKGVAKANSIYSSRPAYVIGYASENKVTEEVALVKAIIK